MCPLLVKEQCSMATKGHGKEEEMGQGWGAAESAVLGVGKKGALCICVCVCVRMSDVLCGIVCVCMWYVSLCVWYGMCMCVECVVYICVCEGCVCMYVRMCEVCV